MNRFLHFTFSLLMVVSCSSNNVISTSVDDDEIVYTQPNILLVIADDMGLDACPGYDIGSTKPNMPNLQNLINSGLKLNRHLQKEIPFSLFVKNLEKKEPVLYPIFTITSTA